MESSTLKCPKCGHPRRGNRECPSCGIIFEKYIAQERRQAERLMEQSEQKQLRQRKILVYGAVVAVVCVLLVLMFSGGSEEPQVASSASPGDSRLAFPHNPYQEYLPQPLVAADVKEELAAATFGVNESRNMVTAFFVTDGCLALTSKFDKKKKSNNSSRDYRRRNISNDAQALRELEDKFEARRKEFLSECVDCSEEAFEKRLGRLQSRLKRKREDLERRESNIVMPTKPENLISITLDRRHKGRLVEVSHDLDLALISVEQDIKCDPVLIADQDSVGKGDEIYLMGWNHRISKGEITGYTKDSGGQKFIMHNARSSGQYGYAGAPAFNKAGEVIGISIPRIGKGHYLVPIDDALMALKIIL
jgi:rubrerythrin